MKLRLAALALFLAVACAPQAFADERFDSLRELLSKPDNYSEYDAGRATHHQAGRKRDERVPEAGKPKRDKTHDRDETQTKRVRETSENR